jgi:hypothetical protein
VHLLNLEQTFDLTKIIQSMLGSTPLWAIVFMIYRSWTRKSVEQANGVKRKFEELKQIAEEDKAEIMAAIKPVADKVDKIELNLAKARIDTLREDVGELQKSNVRHSVKIESIERHQEIKAHGHYR